MPWIQFKLHSKVWIFKLHCIAWNFMATLRSVWIILSQMLSFQVFGRGCVVVFFLLILAGSQRRFFLWLFLWYICSIIQYEFSWSARCILHLVSCNDLFLCSLSQYNFLASWTLARARGKKLCLLDPYTFFWTGCDKVGRYVNFATSRHVKD